MFASVEFSNTFKTFGQLYSKVALFLLCPLSLISCQSDFSVTDKKETRVVIDSFIQSNKVEELDVLVVLDTSCSMSDNFVNVSSGMELLRIDIESLTLDYKFGYITADSNNLGFVGPYDSSSTPIDMMMAPGLLPQTINEEGFAATYAFLSSQAGLEFSRQDSDFLLFLISDEDEQSSITAQIFQDWLHALFADVNHDIVSITTLYDSESDCGFIWDYGWKYEELAVLYNKSALDICDEDWSLWLSESSFITKRQDSIELTEAEPIVKSIVVYVDGSTTWDWEYVKEINTIQLGFIPDYGSLIEVGYKVFI
jgi:hypothetical protein